VVVNPRGWSPQCEDQGNHDARVGTFEIARLAVVVGRISMVVEICAVVEEAA